MIYFRAALVAGTAIFVAYHTTIFVRSIEPSPVLAWILAFLIEGFLISLALMRTVISRILLVPLFLVSVTAASASFVVQNEQVLQAFITRQDVVNQIQEDLRRTEQAYQYGEKYLTRTIQRERMLRDQLREILSQRTGDIEMAKAVVFFVLVTVVQTVSVYTAMTLKKNSAIIPPDVRGDIMEESSETPAETTVSEPVSGDGVTPTVTAQSTASETHVSELVKKTGLSRSTVYRYLRGQRVSPEAMQKIQQALR
ncbi:MAG: helix-turn-helix transcriptional regulator [Candidatus Aenigmatarchaeota archaeon]